LLSNMPIDSNNVLENVDIKYKQIIYVTSKYTI